MLLQGHDHGAYAFAPNMVASNHRDQISASVIGSFDSHCLAYANSNAVFTHGGSVSFFVSISSFRSKKRQVVERILTETNERYNIWRSKISNDMCDADRPSQSSAHT